MKVLLLNILTGFTASFFQDKPTDSSFYPPLGLLYIAKSLIDAGHQVDIIDYSGEKNPDKTLKKHLPSTDVVGITVYSASIKKVSKVTKEIKNYNPNIDIIIGGPHCIYLSKIALKDIPDADICMEGESEESIVDLVTALEENKNLSNISGSHYRKNGKIKSGKPPAVIKDLNSINFPARDLVEKYDYGQVENTFFYKPRFTSILTSRGCPYRCRFCTRHVTSMKTFRKRSVDNILEELREIDDKYNSVMVADDNFLADKKRTHKILDRIIKSDINLEFYIQGARVDSADRELYKKMKKAGVKHLYFGIESGNQDVLDYYRKDITLGQIRKAINLSHEMGFLTRGTFILGAPIETKKHLENTMKFANSLPLDFAIFGMLVYQKGSDLWNEAYKQGKISDTEIFEVYPDPKKGLGNFTMEELEEYCNKAFKGFYQRPQYLVKQVVRSIVYNRLNLLKIGFHYIK